MKTIQFNTDIHDSRQIRELAAAYEAARDAASGYESRILALRVGSLGLMNALAGVAKALGLTFRIPQNTAVKQLKAVEKEAKRVLAGFDEINRLGAPEVNQPAAASSGSSSGPGLDISKYTDTIHRLTVYVSGALLALGAILAFSGANVPLGLGLMAAGAVGLASVAAENWENMSPGVRKALTRVLGILGGAALAIGAILAFTGANVPLGLGLMAAGAAGLAGAAALNWDYIPEKLRQVWKSITGWWDKDIAPCLTAQFWQEKFSAISDGLRIKTRDGINAAIGLLNRFIAWLNQALDIRWGAFSVLGKTVIPAGNLKLASIAPIPMLAKGAVIPPNAPFMAMLGDQRNGTNIEAPEELIRRIVREEAGNIQLSQDFTFDVELDGLTVARKLYRYNRQVQTEHGGSLISAGGA